MLFISDIELPGSADPEAFEEFMRDRYIPAIRMSPTRAGMTEHVELLHEERGDGDLRYLLLVRWSGVTGAARHAGSAEDDSVRAELDLLGAKIIPREAAWREVAARSAD